MRKVLLSLLTTVASFNIALAASTHEELDSRLRAAAAIIDAQMSKESVPGAAIGIVYDQELIWSHRFGVESLKTKNPVSNDTLFSICSVSKLFTGIAAMDLVEAGKLAMDAPAHQYLDGLSSLDSTGAEEPVTVRGILSHVSGAAREGVNDYWGDNSFPDSKELRDEIARQNQLYQPYDRWQYSNLAMAMLGEIIAATGEQSWADYVSTNILKPLGMSNTTTDMPFEKVGRGFANGYYVRAANGKRKAVEPHLFRALAPAAGIASSINDMARFASWHFRLRENGGEEVLKATTLRQMQRVHWIGADFDEPAWGLAYASRRYGDKTLWGHGGYCPGARTEFVMRLPEKIAVIAMTTANDVSPGDLAKTVYTLTKDSIKATQTEDEATAEDPDDSTVAFADYEGYYAVENYDWDIYVGLGADGLFAIPVFDSDPASHIATWVHEEGDVFRRQRKDESLAETITFERDKKGRVVSLVQHSYRSKKRL